MGRDKYLSFILTAPVQDLTGCSDSASVDRLSKFSSTPNTSTHTTPESSPTKRRRVDEPGSSTSQGPQPLTSGVKQKSKGKDLSLLMMGASKSGYSLPKDLLYFGDGTNKENCQEEDWEETAYTTRYETTSQNFVSSSGKEQCTESYQCWQEECR